jgi:hypothetical protein
MNRRDFLKAVSFPDSTLEEIPVNGSFKKPFWHRYSHHGRVFSFFGEAIYYPQGVGVDPLARFEKV